MDAVFLKYALPWIIETEGGYVDDKQDRGGTTKYGISLRFLQGVPDSDLDGFDDGDLNRDGKVDADDIRYLTKEHAALIYHKYFWLAPKCDQLPVVVGLCLFDAMVNHRPKIAAMLIQEVLNVRQDGIIGDKTRAAALQADPARFLSEYLSRRAVHYHDIVAADTTQAKFRRGWYHRLFKLQAFILVNVPR